MLRAWMSPRAALFSAFCVLLSSACKDGSLDVVGTLLANAGTDRTVEVGVSVGLDASLSRDPRGAGLTFRWTLERRPPGSVVVLQGAESVFASFTPDAVGAYGVALRVSNGMAAASASLVVTAVPRSGDLTPPVATITLTPDNPSRDRDPRFAFTSSKPNSRFECTLDGNAPAPCTSPLAYLAVADGAHRFSVVAIDAAGNTSAPAVYAWTLDSARPDTFFLTTPPALAAVNTATFTFGATEPGTFRCALDDAPLTPCESGLTLTALTDGAHTFSVAAVDLAGNADPSPARHRWIVDASAPDTTLTETPRSIAPTSVANFAFTSNEAGATFRCALDETAPAPCDSPWTATNLADGPHTFTVTASDAAGNADATPASFTWTVDTVAPDTILLSVPAPITPDSAAAIVFSSTEEGVTFLCALDGDLPLPCTSPFTALALADGVHYATITAVDAAGNADPRPPLVVWTVDAAAPDTFFHAMPSALTNAIAATFTFGATEPSTFRCTLDDTSVTPCVTGLTLGNLSEGAHVFSVAAVDIAGNVDPTPAVHRWTVDTSAPNTTFTATPALLSSSAVAVFSFASTEAGSTFRCVLDGGAAQSCSPPWTTARLGEGSHTFTVAAVDTAGNADATPALYTWTVDTLPPRTTITTAPASLTRNTTAAFTFTSNESGGTFLCTLDGGAAESCTSPWTKTALANGIHTATLAAIDAAGNAEPRPPLHVWTIDTVAPQTTLLSGPPNPAPNGQATFRFVSSEPGSTFRCSLDGNGEGAPTPCDSPATYTGLRVGTHSFSVFALDPAGNSDATPETFTWTVRAPPTLSYPATPFILTKNTAIPPIVATVTGTGVTFDVSPALPFGLALQSSGAIAGTPLVPRVRATYTISATNLGGTAQATVDLTVNDEAPRQLAYSSNPATYPRGAEITNNVPTYQGGTATSFAVTPAFPAGLKLDPVTGIITGTPSAPASTGTYVITATNAGGVATVAVRLAVVSACNNFNLPFGFGDGTVGNPYLLCTRQHLENITQGNQAASYRLENDLDLGASPFFPLGRTSAVMPNGAGDGADPLAFKGVFDGQNYRLLNLRLDAVVQKSDAPLGLFTHIGAAGVVKNLRLENVNLKAMHVVGGIAAFNNGTITDVSVTGTLESDATAGGVVGTNIDPGAISRATMSGTVRSNARGPRVGTAIDNGAAGIAGISYGGSLTDCRSAGTVTWASGPGTTQIAAWTWAGGIVGYGSPDIRRCSSSADVSGFYYVGGVAGGTETNQSVFDDSFSTGNITGNWGVGGVAGLNGSLMHRCYATGNVNGVTHVGGLVGFNRIAGIGGGVYQSFATGVVSGTNNVGGLIGTFALFGTPANGMTLADSYATGTVTVASDGNSEAIGAAGGLIGRQEFGEVVSSYAAVRRGQGSGPVAAFVGQKTGGTICGSYAWLAPGIAPQSLADVTPLTSVQVVNPASFTALSFGELEEWAMPTANPFSPINPGSGALLAPVPTWLCGKNGVVCSAYAAAAPVCVPVPPPLTDLYFFAGQANAGWDTLGNWWTDASHTRPSPRLPTDGDSVYLLGTVAPSSGPGAAPFPQLKLLRFDSSQLQASFDTESSTVTFAISIRSGGQLLLGVAGDVSDVYRHTWRGSTEDSGSSAVFQGSARQYGFIGGGIVTFNDASRNGSYLGAVADPLIGVRRVGGCHAFFNGASVDEYPNADIITCNTTGACTPRP